MMERDRAVKDRQQTRFMVNYCKLRGYLWTAGTHLERVSIPAPERDRKSTAQIEYKVGAEELPYE